MDEHKNMLEIQETPETLLPGEVLAERVEQIRNMKLFQNMDESQLFKIAASLEERAYPKGSIIIQQNEISRHVLFLVVEGTVELIVSDSLGKEKVAGYRNPNDFFGETTFFSDDRYPGSARAVQDTRVFLLPQGIFEEIVFSNSQSVVFFTRLLSDRMRTLYEKFSFLEENDEIEKESLRRKIADVMVNQPITCSPEDHFRKVASLIHEHSVSSVVVVEQEKPLGIITEGDIVSLVAREQDVHHGQSLTARRIMSSELITVNPGDFTYKALFQMIKHRTKHVPVVDEEKLVGIVTLRDLIKSRQSGALAIINRIESRNSIERIARLREDIDQVLLALLTERATVLEITSLMAEFYDRITRRVIEISEQAMIEEGWGPPPTRYCFIEMGSGGRKEQFTRTDQDNGIIYEDVKKNLQKEVKKYFLTLGEKIVAGLEAFGFVRCDGKVMSNNEKWCRSFKEWRDTINSWRVHWDRENVLMMNIFLDFRHVYGHQSLFFLLRNLVVKTFRNADRMIGALIEGHMKIKVPLSLFRKIITERSGKHAGMISLKSSACVIIVDCIRAFSLREGVLETNTFERLNELGKRNILSQKDVEFISVAYETLMLFRIKDAAAKRKKGLEPDNYIDPNKLTNHEYALLRDALVMVGRLQSITRRAFPVLK